MLRVSCVLALNGRELKRQSRVGLTAGARECLMRLRARPASAGASMMTVSLVRTSATDHAQIHDIHNTQTQLAGTSLTNGCWTGMGGAGMAGHGYGSGMSAYGGMGSAGGMGRMGGGMGRQV